MNPVAALLLALSLVLTGCAGSLLESHAEAPAIYRLASEPLPDRGERLPLALGIARPGAAAALDTDRIAVVRSGSRFDYFAGLRWSEPAPQMLQQQLVRAFAADGRFETVAAAPGRVPADLLLDVELRRFEAEYATDDDAPLVRVEMQVTLVDPRRARRVSSMVAVGSAPAGQNRSTAVIAAFERATAEAIRSAVEQVRQVAGQATR